MTEILGNSLENLHYNTKRQTNAYLFFKRTITAALVIAPKSVYTNWESEIETHIPKVIKYLNFEIFLIVQFYNIIFI